MPAEGLHPVPPARAEAEGSELLPPGEDVGESLERGIRRETVATARLRARILAAVLTVGVPVSFLLNRAARRVDAPAVPIVALLGALVALAVYELVVAGYLGRVRDEGHPPRPIVWHLMGLVEVTVPTLLILLIANHVQDPLLALSSPGPWIYFLFIVLSTLFLDPVVAIGTGLLAAIQYLAVVGYVTGLDAAGSVLVDPRAGSATFHLQKAAVLAFAGVLAGAVTYEIRRRVRRAFAETRERDRVRAVFGQFTAPAVADHLLAHGGNVESRRVAVTVVFMDLRGFSTLAESAVPEELVGYLNRLFEFAIEVIDRHAGVVHQLLGDGMMATFGVPVPREDHASRAVAAALEIADRIEERVVDASFPPPRIGIGLHSGEVVAGLVGSSLHKEYKVTGDVVNVAARIEELTKKFGATVLCSRATLESAGRSLDPEGELGRVSIRGRQESIELYRLR